MLIEFGQCGILDRPRPITPVIASRIGGEGITIALAKRVSQIDQGQLKVCVGQRLATRLEEFVVLASGVTVKVS